mgnify:CR=1 FL=1
MPTFTVPPPTSSACCTQGWNYDDPRCRNTLQDAVDAHAGKGTTDDPVVLQLAPGATYCNAGWSNTHSSRESKMHAPLVHMHGVHNLTIRGHPYRKPRLKFDGSAGVHIQASSSVRLEHLDIEGPALQIDGREATRNHYLATGGRSQGCGRATPLGRLACQAAPGCAWDHGVCAPRCETRKTCDGVECVREDNGGCVRATACASMREEGTCTDHPACQWSPTKKCIGKHYGYYNGVGVSAADSPDLHFSDLDVHHCPSAGIQVSSGSGAITVQDCHIYGNTWWTTSAASGLSLQLAGQGDVRVEHNVAYANRNFMPFFSTDGMSTGGGSASADYGTYMQDYIHDGQGIYITRSEDYTGAVTVADNVAFENGINGIAVQKTTNGAADVQVARNRVFRNGRTSQAWEGRQEAGGVAINGGGQTSSVRLEDNAAEAPPGSAPYMCYGRCALRPGSARNVYCGSGAPRGFAGMEASKFEHAETGCSVSTESYLPAHAPECPQWTPFFTKTPGYACRDSAPGSSP